MKKILSLALAVIMMMLCFAACADSGVKEEIPEEDIVRPPVRESENPAKAEFDLDKSFEELYSDAEIIVRLKVKNWLGDSEHYKRTCFETEILEVYKGEAPPEIVLAQYGTTEWTLSGYPLFDYGTEMILFLKSMDAHIEFLRETAPVEPETFPDFDYENAYRIVGGSMNVWYVSTVDSGDEYLVPNFEMTPLNEELINTANTYNYGEGNENGISLAGTNAAHFLIENDIVLNMDASPKYVFKFNDMVRFIEELSE